MAENTKIEWADHTFNRSRTLTVKLQVMGMHQPVAGLAERDAIRQAGPQFSAIGEWDQVVSVEISASIVSAVDTCKSVAGENVEPPPFVFGGMSFPASFNTASIDKSRRVGSSRSLLSGSGGYECSGLRRMALSCPIRSPSLRSHPHLLTRFLGHLLPLHRRNEGLTALDPCLSHNLASRQFSEV